MGVIEPGDPDSIGQEASELINGRRCMSRLAGPPCDFIAGVQRVGVIGTQYP
jgi:hypothetical protein